MRKVLLAVAVAVLSTTSVFADELRAGTTNVQAFVTDVGYINSSSSGSSWSGGGGFALEHAWTNRVTTVFSVGAERRRLFSFRVEPFNGGTIPAGEFENAYTYPIDLLLRYHFANESRWTPYIGLGGRFVKAPNGGTPTYTIAQNGQLLLTGVRDYENRSSGEVNAGVIFRITPHVGLQLDGKRLLRGDSTSYDPMNKVSVGISWRF
jgi:outer membrane protein W